MREVFTLQKQEIFQSTWVTVAETNFTGGRETVTKDCSNARNSYFESSHNTSIKIQRPSFSFLLVKIDISLLIESRDKNMGDLSTRREVFYQSALDFICREESVISPNGNAKPTAVNFCIYVINKLYKYNLKKKKKQSTHNLRSLYSSSAREDS